MELDLPALDCQLPDVDLFSPEPRPSPTRQCVSPTEQQFIASPFAIDAQFKQKEQQQRGQQQQQPDKEMDWERLDAGFVEPLQIQRLSRQESELCLQQQQQQRQAMMEVPAAEVEHGGYWEGLEQSCMELQQLHQKERKHQQGDDGSGGRGLKQHAQEQGWTLLEGDRTQPWGREQFLADMQGGLLGQGEQQQHTNEDLEWSWEEQQQQQQNEYMLEGPECAAREGWLAQSSPQVFDDVFTTTEASMWEPIVAEQPLQHSPGSVEELPSLHLLTTTSPLRRTLAAAAAVGGGGVGEPLCPKFVEFDLLFPQDLLSPGQGSCGPVLSMLKRHREQTQDDVVGCKGAAAAAAGLDNGLQGAPMDMQEEEEVNGGVALHTLPTGSDCNSEGSVTWHPTRHAANSVSKPGPAPDSNQNKQQPQGQQQYPTSATLAAVAPQQKQQQQQNAGRLAGPSSPKPQVLPPFAERLIMSAPPHPKRIRRAAHSNPISSLSSRNFDAGTAAHTDSAQASGRGSGAQREACAAEQRAGSGGAGSSRGQPRASQQSRRQRGTVRGVLSGAGRRPSKPGAGIEALGVQAETCRPLQGPGTGTVIGAKQLPGESNIASPASTGGCKTLQGLVKPAHAAMAHYRTAAAAVYVPPSGPIAAKAVPEAAPSSSQSSPEVVEGTHAVTPYHTAASAAPSTRASAVQFSAPESAVPKAAPTAAPGAADLHALRQNRKQSKLKQLFPSSKDKERPSGSAPAQQQKKPVGITAAAAVGGQGVGALPVGSGKGARDQVRPILKAPGSSGEDVAAGMQQEQQQRKRVRFSVGDKSTGGKRQHGSKQMVTGASPVTEQDDAAQKQQGALELGVDSEASDQQQSASHGKLGAAAAKASVPPETLQPGVLTSTAAARRQVYGVPLSQTLSCSVPSLDVTQSDERM